MKMKKEDRPAVQALIDKGLRPLEISKRLPHVPMACINGLFHLTRYGPPEWMKKVEPRPVGPSVAAAAVGIASVEAEPRRLSMAGSAAQDPLEVMVRQVVANLSAVAGPGTTILVTVDAPGRKEPLCLVKGDVDKVLGLAFRSLLAIERAGAKSL
jgi:hypothetical protein